jgi:ADP-ribosylglycohydrolase
VDSEPDLARARLSLEGLSIGDAFGELFFTRSPSDATATNLPPGPWPWTDDTHMALSIVEVLERFGRIEQDALAEAFARRFAAEPHRGYGYGAMSLLRQIAEGADWRTVAPALFSGGSHGNGGAMRAAPIGGCFWRDPARAANEAQRSAVITHAHPEGQAGAMAVAAAAALAAQPTPAAGSAFLRTVLPFVPDGLTRQTIELSIDLPGDDLDGAVRVLGTGDNVSAQDTVPFCLWSAAYHLHDFESALWWTVRGLGDRDTTCAIVGGIVALSAVELPAHWIGHREPLPATTASSSIRGTRN